MRWLNVSGNYCSNCVALFLQGSPRIPPGRPCQGAGRFCTRWPSPFLRPANESGLLGVQWTENDRGVRDIARASEFSGQRLAGVGLSDYRRNESL